MSTSYWNLPGSLRRGYEHRRWTVNTNDQSLLATPNGKDFGGRAPSKEREVLAT